MTLAAGRKETRSVATWMGLEGAVALAVGRESTCQLK